MGNFYLQETKSKKFIGIDLNHEGPFATPGWPRATDKLPNNHTTGFETKEEALKTLSEIQNETLRGIGPIANFSFQVVRLEVSVRILKV